MGFRSDLHGEDVRQRVLSTIFDVVAQRTRRPPVPFKDMVSQPDDARMEERLMKAGDYTGNYSICNLSRFCYLARFWLFIIRRLFFDDCLIIF